MSGWNPDLYLRFEAYRTRPAADLLNRVDLKGVRSVVDLGCGPGSSTALLAERWPAAAITGVDSSAAMIARARETYPKLNWIQADLASWRPPAGHQDLIFANASLQWVPDHANLLEGFCSYLHTGGMLAFQVPSIHQQPAAEVYQLLIDTPPWRPFPRSAERLTVDTPSFYHETLTKYCRHVEIWETVYHHVLENHEEMVLWYQSTGLRPFLAGLPDDDARSAFTAELVSRYRAQFPTLADGRVLFPFRRLFVIASR